MLQRCSLRWLLTFLFILLLAPSVIFLARCFGFSRRLHHEALDLTLGQPLEALSLETTDHFIQFFNRSVVEFADSVLRSLSELTANNATSLSQIASVLCGSLLLTEEATSPRAVGACLAGDIELVVIRTSFGSTTAMGNTQCVVHHWSSVNGIIAMPNSVTQFLLFTRIVDSQTGEFRVAAGTSLTGSLWSGVPSAGLPCQLARSLSGPNKKPISPWTSLLKFRKDSGDELASIPAAGYVVGPLGSASRPVLSVYVDLAQFVSATLAKISDLVETSEMNDIQLLAALLDDDGVQLSLPSASPAYSIPSNYTLDTLLVSLPASAEFSPVVTNPKGSMEPQDPKSTLDVSPSLSIVTMLTSTQTQIAATINSSPGWTIQLTITKTESPSSSKQLMTRVVILGILLICFSLLYFAKIWLVCMNLRWVALDFCATTSLHVSTVEASGGTVLSSSPSSLLEFRRLQDAHQRTLSNRRQYMRFLPSTVLPNAGGGAISPAPELDAIVLPTTVQPIDPPARISVGAASSNSGGATGSIAGGGHNPQGAGSVNRPAGMAAIPHNTSVGEHISRCNTFSTVDSDQNPQNSMPTFPAMPATASTPAKDQTSSLAGSTGPNLNRSHLSPPPQQAGRLVAYSPAHQLPSTDEMVPRMPPNKGGSTSSFGEGPPVSHDPGQSSEPCSPSSSSNVSNLTPQTFVTRGRLSGSQPSVGTTTLSPPVIAPPAGPTGRRGSLTKPFGLRLLHRNSSGLSTANPAASGEIGLNAPSPIFGQTTSTARSSGGSGIAPNEASADRLPGFPVYQGRRGSTSRSSDVTPAGTHWPQQGNRALSTCATLSTPSNDSPPFGGAQMGLSHRTSTLLLVTLSGFADCMKLGNINTPQVELESINCIFQEIVSDCVNQSQGVVCAFGAGWALLGWNIGHATHCHTQKACSVALQIRASLQTLLLRTRLLMPTAQLNMAIASGEVLAGHTGTRTHMGLHVMGRRIALLYVLLRLGAYLGATIVLDRNAAEAIEQLFILQSIDVLRMPERLHHHHRRHTKQTVSRTVTTTTATSASTSVPPAAVNSGATSTTAAGSGTGPGPGATCSSELTEGRVYCLHAALGNEDNEWMYNLSPTSAGGSKLQRYEEAFNCFCEGNTVAAAQLFRAYMESDGDEPDHLRHAVRLLALCESSTSAIVGSGGGSAIFSTESPYYRLLRPPWEVFPGEVESLSSVARLSQSTEDGLEMINSSWAEGDAGNRKSSATTTNSSAVPQRTLSSSVVDDRDKMSCE